MYSKKVFQKISIQISRSCLRRCLRRLTASSREGVAYVQQVFFCTPPDISIGIPRNPWIHKKREKASLARKKKKKADHYSRRHPMPLFSITIKCHYLLHLGFHCQQLNPRLSGRGSGSSNSTSTTIADLYSFILKVA